MFKSCTAHGNPRFLHGNAGSSFCPYSGVTFGREMAASTAQCLAAAPTRGRIHDVATSPPKNTTAVAARVGCGLRCVEDKGL